MAANVQPDKASYAHWLQTKYGSIQELNETCNTDFSSFEEFSKASFHTVQKEDRREWGGISDESSEEEKEPVNQSNTTDSQQLRHKDKSLYITINIGKK